MQRAEDLQRQEGRGQPEVMGGVKKQTNKNRLCSKTCGLDNVSKLKKYDNLKIRNNFCDSLKIERRSPKATSFQIPP